MSRPRNVVNFPSDKQNGTGLKVFAMLFYLLLAFMLTFATGLSEGGAWGLAIFLTLYNFFVRERGHKNLPFRKDQKPLFLALAGLLLVLFIFVYKLIAITALLIGGLYWLLVGRTGREAPYFLKFHMLTALIFNLFLMIPYLILNATILLVSHCLILVHMNAAAVVMGSLSSHILPVIMIGMLGGAATWLSISVLLGRTPYIGLVTRNVRPLAS